MTDIITTKHISFTSSGQVRSICQPLFQYFPVRVFEYSRVYQNGQRIELCTNPEHLDNAFVSRKNMNRTYTPSLINENIDRVVVTDWINALPKQKKTNLVEQLRSQKELFEIGNEYVIIHRHFDYVEYFHFYGDANDSGFINTLINYTHLLDHFITYFLNESIDLILEAINQPLVKPWIDLSFVDHYVDNSLTVDSKSFLDNVVVKRFHLPDMPGQYLTRREIDCAKMLLKNHTAKEIANLLSRSVRTIEGAIASVKEKIGCSRKGDVVRRLQTLGFNKLL